MTHVPIVYTIEGNIGSGKSTVLEGLGSRGYTVAPEPVHEWVASGALADYYNGAIDPFTFQCYILQTKVQAFKKVLSEWVEGSILLERGFEADAQVFLKYNVVKGKSTEFQLSLYKALSNDLVSSLPCEFRGTIYLEASPETCLKRVGTRSRTGESSVSLDLLTDINTLYTEYVNTIPENNLFIVDVEDDFAHVDDFINCI